MILKFVSIIIVLASFISCSNSVEDKNKNESSSTFSVQKITTSSGEYKTLVTNFDLPISNKFNIKICFIQNGTNEDIIEEWFELNIQNISYTKKTTTDGCLYFNHSIPFNFIEKEHYIKTNIVITPIGSHKGRKNISIAINPWSKNSDALKDLRYESINDQFLEKDRLQINDQSNLEIESFQFKQIKSNMIINANTFAGVNEYNFQAVPYILRTDIDHNLNKVKLNRGMLDLKFTLLEIDIDNNYKIIAQAKLDNVNIINGKIVRKVSFQLSKDNMPDPLSKIELLVQYIPPKTSILKALNGIYQMRGLSATQSSEIIIVENVADYLTNQNSNNNVDNDTIQANNIINEDIFISKIDLTHKGIDHTSYHLDESLKLSLSKKYRIDFIPKIQIYNSTKLQYDSINLKQGQYNIEAFIVNPNNSNYDINNLNSSDLTLITQTKVKNIQLREDGSINTLLNFRFDIPGLMTLAFENILLLKINSIDGRYQSATFARVFNMTNTNIMAQSSRVDFQTEDLLTLNPVISIEQESKSSNYKFYKSKIKNLVFNGNYKQFNQNIKKRSKIKIKQSSFLNKNDIKIISNIKNNVPDKLLRKFCAQFYNVSTVSNKLTRTGMSKYYRDGKEFRDCQLSPEKYIKIIGNKFVEKIITRGQGINNAEFVNDEQGILSEGDAYFALYGKRSSINDGVRSSDVSSTTLTGGVEGPGPFYIGLSKGRSHQEEVYRYENMADMYATFDRNYIQKQKLKLEYNKLTLRLTAKIKTCITVSNQNASKSALICNDKSLYNTLNESWFFIGRINEGRKSILSNGVEMKDYANYNQIVRGEKSFKRLQRKLANKETFLAIATIGGIDSSNALYSRFKEKEYNFPYANYIDNSFPGMIE